MTQADCAATREHLALGEEAAVSDHLRRCPACRREAEVVRRVIAVVAGADLDAPPPAPLDDAVRSHLRAGLASPRAVLRPAPAIALGLAGVGALCASLTATFVAAGAGTLSGQLGAGATMLYLVVCAAATLPLLFHRVVPSRFGAREVRR